MLASIASAFADNGVSIQVVRQDGHGDEAGLIVRTHRASDAALHTTVAQLSSLDTVRRVLGVMRVEGEAGAARHMSGEASSRSTATAFP